MLKRVIMFYFIIIAFESVFCLNFVLADDEDEEDYIQNELENLIVESSTKPTDEPKINARSAIVYDRKSKEIIWGKNEYEKRAMASTTKIMTAIVVLENSNIEDTIIISKKAANTGGSRLKISTGDKIKVIDLLYGLMLRSRK